MILPPFYRTTIYAAAAILIWRYDTLPRRATLRASYAMLRCALLRAICLARYAAAMLMRHDIARMRHYFI